MNHHASRTGAILGIALAISLLLNPDAHAGKFLNGLKKVTEGVIPENTHINNALKVTESFSDAATSEQGPRQEFELGYQVSAKVLGKYKTLPFDHPATQYVMAVGSTLVLASDVPFTFQSYTFSVLDTDTEINAFAAPGGFVFITKGMLKFLQNEDELAAILGHEISHVELGHGVKSIRKESWMKFASTGVGVAASETGAPGADTDAFESVVGEVSNAVIGGYSREFEGDADKRGAELCLAVGYDPHVLPGVLERFKDKTGSYGGANYPRERSADLAAYVNGMRQEEQPDVQSRATRYKQMLASLTAK